MPHRISKSGGGYRVTSKGTGKTVGKAPTRKAAVKAMVAAKKSRRGGR